LIARSGGIAVLGRHLEEELLQKWPVYRDQTLSVPLQHVLAVFVGIITPPLIVVSALVIQLTLSLGLGLGVTFVPELLQTLPPLLKNTLSSGIAIGGVSALLLNTVLPGER
jgi:xanthine/uracil permease